MKPLTVLVSVDGMRPDGLMAAEAPVMQQIVREGWATLEARTVMPSVTLPCHTSMFRGVDVERHGITSNTFQPIARPVPSIVDVAHAHGWRCGAFFNWGPLRDLYDPESVSVSMFLRDAHRPEGDGLVAEAFVEHLAALDFAFVYLGWTDECGHLHGWMSPEYLEAIANADRCLDRVVQACQAARRPWRLLLLSDHGGHGRSHGTDRDEDMTIPWALTGPEIPRGTPAAVRIYDTAPTLAALMSLPLPREWEGTPRLA